MQLAEHSKVGLLLWRYLLKFEVRMELISSVSGTVSLVEVALALAYIIAGSQRESESTWCFHTWSLCLYQTMPSSDQQARMDHSQSS